MPKKVKIVDNTTKPDTKKSTKKVLKKEPVQKEVTPEVVKAADDVVEAADVVVEAADVVVEDQTNTTSVSTIFSELIEQGDTLAKSHKGMTLTLKKVLKSYLKECKEIHKQNSKSRKSVGGGDKPKRSPSGFAKPTDISNTLCDFLEIPHGQQMARTDVTKKVTQYIKDKQLQVPENRRKFIPDKNLGSILGPLDKNVKGKDGLTDAQKGYTYFNLQRYLSDQFIKA
jgi:chromatin remodeling complex protein RSC6